jgi:hypothetical protein
VIPHPVGGITHIEKEKEMEEGLDTIDVSNIYDINEVKSIVASLKSALVIMTIDKENNKSMRIEGRTKHERDIELIGNALLQEAKDRDWCSAYDDFIEVLNRSLTVELKSREHEYEVEIEVTRKQVQRVTVTVTARDEDHARQLIEDNPSNYYEDEINEYDWEVEDEDSDITDVTLQ